MHLCPQGQERKAMKHDYDDAKEVPESEAADGVFDEEGNYWPSLGEYIGHLREWNMPEEFPEFVLAAERSVVSLDWGDIEKILDDIKTDNGSTDDGDTIEIKGIAELGDAIKAFNASNAKPDWFMPDYTRKVRVRLATSLDALEEDEKVFAELDKNLDAAKEKVQAGAAAMDEETINAMGVEEPADPKGGAE